MGVRISNTSFVVFDIRQVLGATARARSSAGGRGSMECTRCQGLPGVACHPVEITGATLPHEQVVWTTIFENRDGVNVSDAVRSVIVPVTSGTLSYLTARKTRSLPLPRDRPIYR